MVRRYFEYLERSAPLVQRLCDTGVPTWVLFGDHDEVGLTTEERGDLQACPHVALDTLAGATHMLSLRSPSGSPSSFSASPTARPRADEAWRAPGIEPGIDTATRHGAL